LSQYTYLYDLTAPDQIEDRTDQRSHVISLESIYNLSKRWELGAKLATRRSHLRSDRGRGKWYKNGVNLVVTRLRYHLTNEWDGLLEYRALQGVQTKDLRAGFLLGAYRHVGDNLKLGFGYNFTDYTDDLTDMDYEARGMFFDLIGKW